MISCPIYNLSRFLPHSGNMVMLDYVTKYSQKSITAYTKINKNNILVENGFLHSIAYLEIMAQSIACLSGIIDYEKEKDIKLGFLLGSRNFDIFVSELNTPCNLKIVSKQNIIDNNGFAIYHSMLYLVDNDKDSIIAQGELNVYSPENIEDALKNNT